MKTSQEMVKFCRQYKLGTGLTKRGDLKHFKVIEQELEPDENIYAAWIALNFRNNVKWAGLFACAATNKSLILSQKKMFGVNTQILPLCDVQNISLTEPKKFMSIFSIKSINETLEIEMNSVEAQNTYEYLSNLEAFSKVSFEKPKATTKTKTRMKNRTSIVPLPEFPQVDKYGNKILRTVSFTLSGVNHVHDGSDPQKIIKPSLRGQWLTLKAEPQNKYDNTAVKVLYKGKYIGWLPNTNETLAQWDAKKMISRRLCRGMEVLARFDATDSLQIGGYDLDELDPRINKYMFETAIITCAIYEFPRSGN